MPTRCVLIVEDDESIRETLRIALEFENYRVCTASNGREGIEVLKGMESPCVILLDLMMPIMNGWDFAAALEKDMVLATIPIVVVSAFTEKTTALSRARKIIKKPVDLDHLVKAVGQYCG